jgi:hypothetical protein
MSSTPPLQSAMAAPAIALKLNSPASPEPFLARFWRRQTLPKIGTGQPIPAASTGRRSGDLRNPSGRTGGTQTHSRRTVRKLGRLRCARQGLVRVPESNTKYGGNRGKTGVAPRPPSLPSISESSGIPKRKKLFSARRFWLRPAVHRTSIYCARGVAKGRLT